MRSFASLLGGGRSLFVAAAISAPRLAPLFIRHSHTISFITDVEGNLTYFQRIVKDSPVLRFTDETHSQLELRPNTSFIYGGDCFDKGPGEIRISRMLVNLKQRYPDRVFLLLGNRDVNKLKLTTELYADETRSGSVHEILPGSRPMVSRLLENMYEVYLRRHNVQSTALHRLRFILSETMNCKNTFEFRRQELAILSARKTHDIDDMEVAKSFLDGLDPGGFYWEYVAHGDLAVNIGNTLFVHGAVSADALGCVPAPHLNLSKRGPVEFEQPAASVSEWISRLNSHAKGSAQEWRQQPGWEAGGRGRRGQWLMAYARRDIVGYRSVMVGDFLPNGHLEYVPAAVSEYLRKSGITRIVTGHKPVGDSPVLIRDPDGSLEVVMGDTSFSDTTARDNRGRAWAEILIHGEQHNNRLQVRGCLHDGRAIDVLLPRRDGAGVLEDEEESPIGQSVVLPGDPDRWWMKAFVGGDVNAVSISGFTARYKNFPQSDLA